MEYRKMDALKIALINNKFFMHMPGQQPKYGNLAENPQHKAIFDICSPITKEEFETNMPNSNALEALYSALYFNTVESIKPIPQLNEGIITELNES